MPRAVAIVLITGFVLALGLLLGGCASAPTPFELGAEAPPPAGCVEGRSRGVDC